MAYTVVDTHGTVHTAEELYHAISEAYIAAASLILAPDEKRFIVVLDGSRRVAKVSVEDGIFAPEADELKNEPQQIAEWMAIHSYQQPEE